MEPSLGNESLDESTSENSCKFKPLPSIKSLPRIPKIKSAVADRPTIDSAAKDNDIPFGKLSIVDLEYVPVPDAIKKIEHENDISGLVEYKNLCTKPTTMDEYVNKFTNLIHFEEAANSKHLRNFYLKSVYLKKVCHHEQTFKICPSTSQDLSY